MAIDTGRILSLGDISAPNLYFPDFPPRGPFPKLSRR